MKFSTILTISLFIAAPAYSAELLGQAHQNDAPVAAETSALPENTTSVPEKITHKKITSDSPNATNPVGNAAGGNNLDDGTSRIRKSDDFNEHTGYQSGSDMDQNAARNPVSIVTQH